MRTPESMYRYFVSLALAAAFILLIPLVAMQFTDEVNWNFADFAAAWGLIVGAGLTYKLVVRKMGNNAYRAAVGVAVASALLLIWINLAVGVIGIEGNPANMLYIGVLAVGIIGTIIARFRPWRMSQSLLVTALAQALVAMIALIAGLDYQTGGPGKIVILNGFFIALWLGSAWLFRNAARKQAAVIH